MIGQIIWYITVIVAVVLLFIFSCITFYGAVRSVEEKDGVKAFMYLVSTAVVIWTAIILSQIY